MTAEEHDKVRPSGGKMAKVALLKKLAGDLRIQRAEQIELAEGASNPAWRHHHKGRSQGLHDAALLVEEYINWVKAGKL